MKKILALIITLITYIVALCYFFPIILVFVTGFKNEGNAISMPPSFLFEPTLENYKQVIDSGVITYLKNSAIVAVSSTFLALLMGIPAAYALAMLKLKKEENILFWFISTKMLPAVGVIIPIYLIFKSLNLLDNTIGLVILYTAMNVPLVVWMMRSFFKEVPYEVIEAYKIEGASALKGFYKVLLPMISQGVISTSLLCIIFAWNEFFLAVSLTYTNSATLPVYMASFMAMQGLFWAKMSAVASIAILPPLILGWFTQKQLIRGLTMGAVKG